MKPIFSIAILSGLLALSACDTPAPKVAHITTQTASHTIIFGTVGYSAHTVCAVKTATPAPTTRYTGYATRLGAGEKARLAAFLDTFPVSAVSTASLRVHDMSAASVARAKAVRDFLVSRGVDRNRVLVSPTHDIDAAMILLTVDYSVAVPPRNCPDWSKNATANYLNTDDSNLGCATTSDLVLQLADPADYDGSHSQPRYDGPRESAVLSHYMANIPQPMSTVSSSNPTSTAVVTGNSAAVTGSSTGGANTGGGGGTTP